MSLIFLQRHQLGGRWRGGHYLGSLADSLTAAAKNSIPPSRRALISVFVCALLGMVSYRRVCNIFCVLMRASAVVSRWQLTGKPYDGDWLVETQEPFRSDRIYIFNRGPHVLCFNNEETALLELTGF
jgi:hypothetical protein